MPLHPSHKRMLCSNPRVLGILGENLSAWWISMFWQELSLLDGILEQVLGERILHSKWRSQWLLLGNGILLCHCKSLGSNKNFPEIVTVLRWPRIPRSSPFRTKWGAQQRITSFCTAAFGCVVWGLLQPGWMDLLWLNMLRGFRGNGIVLSHWK